MECHSQDLANQQLLLIFEPIVRHRNRHIGDAKHLTLRFEILPQVKIMLMQTERRPCRLLHFAGCKKMVEVGVSVKNMCDRQSKLVHFVENSLGGATRTHHNRLFRHRIADDRAIATKGRDGKCFSDHGRQHGRMLPSKPIKAQAAALLLDLAELESSTQLPYRTTSSFALDGGTTREIPLRCRLGEGFRHTAAHDRCAGFAPHERRPNDPRSTALEPSCNATVTGRPGTPPALRRLPCGKPVAGSKVKSPFEPAFAPVD